MKKKLIVIALLVVLIIIVFNVNLMASLKAKISSSSINVKEGEEINITLRFEEYKDIKEGINAYKATLDYDKNIFEEVEQDRFICKNNWEKLKYNKQTGEFVAIKKSGTKAPEDVVNVKLKVKQDVKATTTDVKIKNITASEGEKDIQIDETKISINIIEDQEEKPEEPKVEKIISDKYTIETDVITRILPETTVGQFKQNVTVENVTTEPKMVFTDSEGNILDDNSLIVTGTKLKVGNNLEYILIVIGDINGNSKIDIKDLAKMKLHIIDKELLEGIELKAADIDGNNLVTINDLAKMKLILIDKLELN